MRLSEIVGVNSSFKTAINLYLSLNKPEKIMNYIPTKSSVSLLDEYLQSILTGKEQASLLIGPYGKGKSHLLLILLAILSLERNSENEALIKDIVSKIDGSDALGRKAAEDIMSAWGKKKYLPVILNDSKGDLNQAFLLALSDALRRAKLEEIAPDTFYSIAVSRLDDWEKNYPDTFLTFGKELEKYSLNIDDIKAGLRRYSEKHLQIFKALYPNVTSGSEFNPLAVSEVLPLYKSVAEKIVEDYGYSGIYIVFDEFSKFIEGQDKSGVGNNMKTLQDVCELATESSNAEIHITMVAHKSIKEYGKYLSQDIINSFTGIEGRIVEKYFITSSKNNYELIKNAIKKDDEKLKKMPYYEALLGEQAIKRFHELPAFRSNFDETDFADIVLRGCYPLNPIAAYLLLNVSEKVAQNERTLFTFISNDEPNSMARFVAEHEPDMDWSIGADLIYDYFRGLFRKEVSNELVHNIWLGAEYALSKCDDQEEQKIIKSLAIIAIVNKEDEIPANDKYLALLTSISDSENTIASLVKKDLIYKKSTTGNYVFKTRAGTALKTEIRNRRELKGNRVDLPRVLQEVTGNYYMVPRKYNVDHSITRYFDYDYMDSNDFLSIESPEVYFDVDSNADGRVICLYSFGDIDQSKIRKHFEHLNCNRLVVVAPKKRIDFFKQARDYEIISELKQDRGFLGNNEILKKELPIFEDDLMTEISNAMADIYHSDNGCSVYYFVNGKVKKCKSEQLEMAINSCCDELYIASPDINNEMINKAIIGTAQTRKARLTIVDAILNHKDTEEFYSGTNQEATIYRSLLVKTHVKDGNANEKFNNVISKIDAFIDSCSDTKNNMASIVHELTSAPIGMRMGVLPIFLAYVLSQRREDLIIYYSDMEVAISADIVVNMCENASDYALFVSGEDVAKEKYINSLNELFGVADNRNLTENRIKNIFICMQRWYRALPQASRNLADIDSYGRDLVLQKQMRVVRRILQQIDYNSYESLFVTLPKELEAGNLEETYIAIDRVRTAYDDYFQWIQDTTVKCLIDIFGGKKKRKLTHVLKEWYEKQSETSKQGLHSSRVTNFMSCIETLNTFNDSEVAERVVKAISDTYMEDWNTGSLQETIALIQSTKAEIEQMIDSDSEGKWELSFRGTKGQQIVKRYDRVDEGTGSVLRNIIEDALDQYDDLSVNDRVAILLEMVEKVIGR